MRSKESLNCNSPSSESGKSQDDALHHVSCTTLVSSNQMRPASRIPQSSSRGTALIVVLITLASIGLVGALFYLKKINFKPSSSLLDTVSRKVQYTTIGHHEDEVEVEV